MEKNEARLNRREREVLVLLGRGKTSKEIADALQIAVDTVASHRRQLRQKLGLHSTAELVSYAALKSTQKDE